ncbi:MAG: hypothetical protein ABGY75_15905 [Gemmataceae bacterium]
MPATQERGKFIIDKTGVSSSFSAANGAIDHVKAFVNGTPKGDWTSAAVVCNGEYGVPKGLVFGYPVTTSGGNWKVVEVLTFDEFSQAAFAKTLKELQEEREAVKDLLPG